LPALRALSLRAAGSATESTTMSPCGRLALVLFVAGGVVASAQDQGRYRSFQLGTSVATIAASTNARTADVTLVHARPALMQELRWAPSSFGVASRTLGQGLEKVTFSFYENQLYRIVVDYERAETRGMTDRDMVDAISSTYGEPSSSQIAEGASTGRGAERTASRLVARWSAPGYAVAVSRWAYGDAWRLVIETTALAALARDADARAIALDLREGPDREAARSRREQQDKYDADAAARTANKATFRP
jgi:hypothetical protein